METFIQVTTDGIQIVIPWAWRGPFILALIFGTTILAARLIPPVGRFFAALGLPETTRAELRLDTLPKPLSRLLVAFWAALFIVLFAGILWDLAKLALDVAGGPDLTHDTSQGATDARADHRWTLLTLTALTAAISAVIALPFTIIRIGHSRRQTRTAEENLTTDLINKAVEGLGAEKTIRRNGEDHTAPNLEVRIGAIYQLERIARIQAHSGTEQGAADHIRIMKILCAYVRENAGPPKDLGLKPWRDYPEYAKEQKLKIRTRWRRIRAAALRRRVAALPKPRSDIQTALEVLGSRDDTQYQIERADIRRGQPDGYHLDLRDANLQAAHLSYLDFRHADFTNARMEGANLRKAYFDKCELSDAHLERAILRAVQMEAANLHRAILEGAELHSATITKTKLEAAHLQNSRIHFANAEGANLRWASLEGADIRKVHLKEADLQWARIVGTDLRFSNMEEVTLDRAYIEGTDLRWVNLKRASWADTKIFTCPTHFADLRDSIYLDQYQLMSLIGNAATLLPEIFNRRKPLVIPSCWKDDPRGFETLQAVHRQFYPLSNDLHDVKVGFFCDPSEQPIETGTPWPLDRDPPWGSQRVDEEKVQYDSRITHWAEREDAKRRADGPFLDPAQ